MFAPLLNTGLAELSHRDANGVPKNANLCLKMLTSNFIKNRSGNQSPIFKMETQNNDFQNQKHFFGGSVRYRSNVP